MAHRLCPAPAGASPWQLSSAGMPTIPAPSPVLTSGAVGPVAAQLTHLAGRSVEALVAVALPTAQEPVLALSVARAHPTHTPRAWLTQCAKETRAAVRHLRGRGDRYQGKAKCRGGSGPQGHRAKQVGPGNGGHLLPLFRGRGEVRAGKGCAGSHREGQSWAQLLPLGLYPSPQARFLGTWPQEQTLAILTSYPAPWLALLLALASLASP